VGGFDYREGDWLSLDGNTGNFYSGQLKVFKPALSLAFCILDCRWPSCFLLP
jgi:hypothetical protein